MNPTDIELALELCRAAGWNQLDADWRRLLQYEPDGCFVAMLNGQLAGTITTTRYGLDLGWIGMMLISPQFRRRGIATKLMQRGISYLKSQNVRCIKLDATPAGLKVYERLGFEVEWSFQRWQRNSRGDAIKRVKPQPTPLPTALLEMDRDAFGADRSELLQRFGDGSYVCVRAEGFGMLRPGYLADYLGPTTARTASEAKSIIVALLDETDRTVFWDIPGSNSGALRIVHSLDLEPVRDLTRMWLGDVCRTAKYSLQYALAEPGTG